MAEAPDYGDRAEELVRLIKLADQADAIELVRLKLQIVWHEGATFGVDESKTAIGKVFDAHNVVPIRA